MSREKYVKQRNSFNFEINDLYDFYIEKCTDKCVEFSEFEMKLPMYLNLGGNFNKYISEKDAHYNILKLDANGVSSYY